MPELKEILDILAKQHGWYVEFYYDVPFDYWACTLRKITGEPPKRYIADYRAHTPEEAALYAARKIGIHIPIAVETLFGGDRP